MKMSIPSRTLALVVFLACCYAPVSLLADPPSRPDATPATVDVDSQIVSDYIWRGHNLLSNYNVQRQKAEGMTSGAWAFQPTVKINTPVDGLSFTIFGSFALVGRKDVDVDNRIQTSPGGAFIGPGTSIYDPAFTSVGGASILASMPGVSQGVAAYANAPTFYKEPVGLQRNDEIDLTIGYEKDARVGVIGFGLIHYSYSNSAGKGNPFLGCSGVASGSSARVNCGTGYFSNEVYFSYAFPFFKDLKFSLYSEMVGSSQYYNATYAHSWQVSKSLAVDTSLGAGYYVFPQLQGMSDVTAKLGINYSGFKVAVNGAYRPNARIQDYNFGFGDSVTRLPLTLNGGSTAYDGQSIDYSKMYGPANEYMRAWMSSQITNSLNIPFTYTPRQRVAPVVVWLNFGYTFTI